MTLSVYYTAPSKSLAYPDHVVQYPTLRPHYNSPNSPHKKIGRVRKFLHQADYLQVKFIDKMYGVSDILANWVEEADR